MCTTCNPLHKAADRAATQALGARQLLEAMANYLPAESYAKAVVFCEGLELKAKETRNTFLQVLDSDEMVQPLAA
jgi:hypothetical protein